MKTDFRIEQAVSDRFEEGYTEEMFKSDLKCYHDALIAGLILHTYQHKHASVKTHVIAYTALVKDEQSGVFRMRHFDNMLSALGFNILRGYSAVVYPTKQMSCHFEILAYMLNSGMVTMEEYNNLAHCDVHIF